MVSTVKSRPNHYQALGLEPGASEDEIKRSFARRMAMFPSLGEAAQIGIAYEVLRNPAKRRAYDETLGLKAQAKPSALPTAVSFQGSARFSGIAPKNAAAPVEAPQEPEAAPDRAPKAFIASSPREPVEAEAPVAAAAPAARPSSPPLPLGEAERNLHSKIGEMIRVERARGERSNDGEERPLGWSRPGAAVAGLVLAVALVGAWAGSEAGDAADSQLAPRALRVALPPAKAAPAAASPAVAANPPPRGIEWRVRRAPQQRRPLSATDRLAEVSQALESGDAASSPTETASAEAPPQPALVAAAAAPLPLPNATVARTIERIGYPCGRVASTAAGEAPGVFTVTCTSGHSYQAKPVHGRYRFRRM